MWRSLGYPVVDGPTSIAQAEKLYASRPWGKLERGEKVVAEWTAVKRSGQFFAKESSAPDRTSCFPMSRYGGPGSMYHELLTGQSQKAPLPEWA